MIPPRPGRLLGDALVRAGCLAFAIAAAWLVMTATPYGLGMTPDSVHYLRASNALIGGRIVDALSPHWPTGYPAAIALSASLGGTTIEAARVLNACLACLNALLLAMLASRCRWPRALVLAVPAVALQAGMLHAHFLMWSEALFQSLVLATLLLLEQLVEKPARRWLWVALTICTAASIQVRYAGVFLIAVNVVVLAFSTRRATGRTRVALLATSSGLALLPTLLIAAYNASRGLGAVNRSIAWHPPTIEHVASLQTTVAGWFGASSALGLPILGVILAAAAWAIASRLSEKNDRSGMAAISATAVWAYASFLLASISFVDHYSPLDERLLLPMFPLAWIVLIEAACSLPTRLTRVAAMVLLSVLLTRGIGHALADWRHTREHGLGLTSRQIREMPILQWMQTLPPQLPIVSNGPDLCTIYLGRETKMLPANYNPTSGIRNPDVQAELEGLLRDPTIIVHFRTMAFRKYLIGPGELAQLPGMRVVYRGPDATAWIRHADRASEGASDDQATSGDPRGDG